MCVSGVFSGVVLGNGKSPYLPLHLAIRIYSLNLFLVQTTMSKRILTLHKFEI